jgi:hypothetical protein
MTTRPYRRIAATVTFLMLSSLPVLAAAEPCPEQGEPGDLWEVTSQMSMEGMPMSMPARTIKLCSPKEWKEPPGPADEQMKCKTSDFKKDGAKVTWRVCAGPPEMTGDGEITRNGADSYTGTIKFTSSQGTMTIKLNGRRLSACELPRK